MNELRKKAIEAGLGSTPPNWGRDGLGKADFAPDEITRGLGLSRFVGTGSDWMTDVVRLLGIAFKSRYLEGLYSDPVPYRSRGGISVGAASDLYSYSPAVMQRMVKSTLWAAERTGKIALPSRLKVEVTPDQRALWIHI